MSNPAVGFARGETAFQGVTPVLEGGLYRGDHATATKLSLLDKNYGVRYEKPKLSNMEVDLLVCRNEASGSIAPKTVVVLAADLKTFTKATDTALTPYHRLAVVDEYLPNNVAVHDTCYVVIGGPTTALCDYSGGAGAAGDLIVCNNAGKVVAQTAAPADATAALANAMANMGWLLAATQTTDTSVRVFLKRNR